VQIDSDQLSTARSGAVDQIDAIATASADELVLFLVNRSLDRAEPVTIDVGDGVLAVRSARTITPPEGGTRFTANTADLPEAVTPVPLTTVSLEGSSLIVELPALSWSVIRLRLSAGAGA
jgi:alpha-N-arabinofuranosidase